MEDKKIKRMDIQIFANEHGDRIMDHRMNDLHSYTFISGKTGVRYAVADVSYTDRIIIFDEDARDGVGHVVTWWYGASSLFEALDRISEYAEWNGTVTDDFGIPENLDPYHELDEVIRQIAFYESRRDEELANEDLEI